MICVTEVVWSFLSDLLFEARNNQSHKQIFFIKYYNQIVFPV